MVWIDDHNLGRARPFGWDGALSPVGAVGSCRLHASASHPELGLLPESKALPAVEEGYPALLTKKPGPPVTEDRFVVRVRRNDAKRDQASEISKTVGSVFLWHK